MLVFSIELFSLCSVEKLFLKKTLFLFIYLLLLFYVYGCFCLHEYLCGMCVQCLRSPEEDELDLQMVVRPHVAAGTRTWVLCKTNKCP